MASSLALAAPAATMAALAYINARCSVFYDARLIYALAMSLTQLIIKEKRDRVNMFYQLEENAKSGSKTANKPFISFQGREWTYKETYDMALRYGNWFKTRFNVKSGDIVALDLMNSDNFMFFWLGLWSIGACPAFINYNLTGKPLVHSISTSTARIIIVDTEIQSAFTQDILDELSTVNGGVDTVILDPVLEAEVRATPIVRQPDSCRSGPTRSSMATLIYTSGTTGLPKAAIVNWHKFTLLGPFLHYFIQWGQDDRMYTCMPLYHSSAASLAVSASIASGACLIIGRRFSTKTFWKDVRESRATMIQYVGETCRYLLAGPTEVDSKTGENLDKHHNVRLALGNGLRPDVWSQFKDRFNVETIVEFYGSTEGFSAFWNLSNNSFSQGAIGRNGSLLDIVLGPVNVLARVDWDAEAPFRDPETGFAQRLPYGESGELLWKIKEPKDTTKEFQGYFGNDKATNAKILRDLFSRGDAWFRTGDIMRRDNEGRWYFSDRLGDTYRWKSENVSTSEVGEVLGAHSSIHEANVYGVALPHHEGRAGCAAVHLVSEDGASISEPSPELLQSIAELVQAGLPRFAVPLFLRVMADGGSSYRTGTNKQQKHELRSQGVNSDLIPSNNGLRDRLYWLQRRTYVPFERRNWEAVTQNRVRL